MLISGPLGPRLRGLISLLEYWLLCLFDSADEKFESLLVLGGNEEVLAHILVAAATRVALVEAEDFVAGGLGSCLDRDHRAGARREALVVGGVLQLAVPLVAGALARVLAAVQTVAEVAPLGLR